MYTKKSESALSKLSNLDQQSNFTQKSKSAFTYKGFYNENKQIYFISKLITAGVPILSIVTGAAFLYSIFIIQLHFILAVVFSFVLVSLVELLKNKVLNKGFLQFFRSSINPILAALILFLSICSIVLSISGIQSIETTNYTNKDAADTKSYTIKKDSINKYYDDQVIQEKNDLADFKRSITYRGNIDMSNKSTKKYIDISNNNKTLIINKREAALQELKQEQQTAQAAAAPVRSINKMYLLFITIFIEVLIIGSSFFNIYFMFRTHKEEDLVSIESTPISINVSELKTLINTYASINNMQQAELQKKDIGFINNQVQNANSKENASIKSNKHTSIYKAIEAGEVDIRVLTKYGYSVVQVNELLKKFKS